MVLACESRRPIHDGHVGRACADLFAVLVDAQAMVRPWASTTRATLESES